MATGPSAYTWPGGYITYNNEWNDPNAPSSGPGSQVMYACSAQDVTVVADMPPPGMDNTSVKTYPAVQKDYNAVPVSSIASLNATWAETDPRQSGDDYEDAFDIWLNGVANSTSNELMIWTENYGQTPAGSPQAQVSLDGHSWTVYATSGYKYVAFVANSNFTSGALDLTAFWNWAIAHGWYASTTTVDQVNYGIEICSTNLASATFTITNFGLS